MKRHLLMEFLFLHLLIGILGFFSITFVGSILIEQFLEGSISKGLMVQAENIAADKHLIQAYLDEDKKLLTDHLRTISNYEDASIWLMTPDHQIVAAAPEIKNATVSTRFHPESWQPGSHLIGRFYGYFKKPRISVVSPMSTEDGTTLAYIIIHYRMEWLYIRRASALRISQILFILMYLLSFGTVVLYYFRIHRPLQEITTGASAYANGDLSYRIQVNSQDEMGYLANTLNYMSDVLNQNGEYQKQFVSNVSHDFRSPLTSIKGYINAILDGTIPPELQEHYLKVIASETERLEKLTGNLLSLNELDIKKRTLNPTSFDIHQVIYACIALFEGISKDKKIQFILNFAEEEFFVYADEQQINQVVYNLIDNAIKFSPKDSSITIATTKKNGKVFVSIADHGYGIPKESLSKIWTRFYKLDPSRGKDRTGTGLGLPIVKEIIHAHGQQIDVISTEGVGTEFIFTLKKA